MGIIVLVLLYTVLYFCLVAVIVVTIPILGLVLVAVTLFLVAVATTCNDGGQRFGIATTKTTKLKP